MKNRTTAIKKILMPALAAIFFLSAAWSCVTRGSGADVKNQEGDYYVAAYIWPSCHDEEMSREALWDEGMGEWEIIKKGTPRFEGHYQPKVPLWGYEMDDDPEVMEKWIEAATDNGINVFIFDWYWYDGGPYLESTLNNGFLKAKNNDKMQFYIMWANHDVARNYWNVHRYGEDNSRLWSGETDWDNFRIIVERVIRQYFRQPNYFKIDGAPVFSVFSYNDLIETFGSVDETARAFEYFREEVKKAGFPDLHLQLIGHGTASEAGLDFIKKVGANSVTKYNWGGPIREDYVRWGTESMERRAQWDEALDIPYFPNATIGWDDSPRFPGKGPEDIVHYNNSPESFATFLQKAKEYCDEHPEQPKLITVFSWNEWIEGGYLLPDMKYGFGYLDAVKRVINGDYDRYK